MNIKEMRVFDRPREKLLRYGQESLMDYELLALVIGTGTRECSAISLAERILQQQQEGILSLQNCTVEELAQIHGVGIAKGTKIVAALELGKRLITTSKEKRMHIRNSEDVVGYFMNRMRHLEKEVFNILLLDTKGGIIAIETISIGDLSQSIVHPRETFRSAVKRGAWGIILAHNHPSGDPAPSAEDIETTQRLRRAGEILGIRVLDHIIIGDNKFVSLKAEGIFNQ